MDNTTQQQSKSLNLNIGKTILNDLQEEGRSVAWLAKKIGIGRPNVYYHLNNESFSIELLWSISLAMKHNYLAEYSALLNKQISDISRKR